MKRVSILVTGAQAARFDDYLHGDTVFAFDLLEPSGPRRLMEGPTWAFVDWVMDDLSGLEMCRRLRADPRTRDAHVTMVLEQDDSEDRRRALKAGADDYAIGPLSRQAMLDRVLALHHAGEHRPGVLPLNIGALQINLVGQQVLWRGQRVPLRPNEFRLLRFMAENPNRVLSRHELLDGLGKAEHLEYERTVDVWVKRLRQGLAEAGAADLLRTVHGKGYVLDVS